MKQDGRAVLFTRREAMLLLPALAATTLCGCRTSRRRAMPDYESVKEARFVHFSHGFTTRVGGPACKVNVRQSEPGRVRLDFSTLGVAWNGKTSFQSQTLCGELGLELNAPVTMLGFINTLRLQVYKPRGFRVTVYTSLGGSHRTFDFAYDSEVEGGMLERASLSLMSWKQRHGWENPPPYRLAIQLFIIKSGGEGTPSVIIESLGIQAVEV